MPEFVRVRIEDGEASVTAEFAKRHNLKPLDKPTLPRDGRAFPAKYDPLTSPAKTAAAKKEK